MNQDDCDRSFESRCSSKTGAWRKSLIGSVTIIGAFLLIAYLSLGRFGIEKVLTGFVMPVGFGWLLLTTSVLFSWLNGATRVNRWMQSVVWIVLTLSSTAPLPNFLMHNLESKVSDEFHPDTDQPLDVLIVFGGGTRLGPSRAEAADAGDRVLYAAQLYLQGNAKRLITTGNEVCEQTSQIWQKLRIPENDIAMLPGANTFQEIESLKPFLQQSQQQRLGILSSAYHLPRIQRLAEKAGVTGLIPVAANHRSGGPNYTILDLVPSSASLVRFSDAYKEWLGRIVGR